MIRHAIFFIFGLVLAAPLFADTVVHYTISDGLSSQPDKRVAYVANGMVRVVNTAGRIEPEAIFDSNTGDLTLIDHQQKSYIKVNEEELTAMAGQIKNLIDSVMSELPFNNPLAPRQNSKSVKHSGVQRRFAGISCELYEIQVNGEKESEVCIAKSNRLDISPNDYETLESLYKTGDKLARTARETIGQSLGPIPEFGAGDLGGLPVYIMSVSSGSQLELILKDISSELVSAEYFKIPEGYQRQSLPSLL